MRNKKTGEKHKEVVKPTIIVTKTFNWLKFFSMFASFITAFIASFFITKFTFIQVRTKPTAKKPLNQIINKNEKINFSGNRDLLYLDPVLLKAYIDSQDKNFVLVDIRSPAEFKYGHIKGAVNVPLYTDYLQVYSTAVKKNDWLKQARQAISSKRNIIVYGYSLTSDLMLVTVNDLKKEGWPIKILGVDWNDWQNNFYQWMPGAALGAIDNSQYLEREVNGPPPIPPAVNVAPIVQP